jgi:hypothetical protein
VWAVLQHMPLSIKTLRPVACVLCRQAMDAFSSVNHLPMVAHHAPHTRWLLTPSQQCQKLHAAACEGSVAFFEIGAKVQREHPTRFFFACALRR